METKFDKESGLYTLSLNEEDFKTKESLLEIAKKIETSIIEMSYLNKVSPEQTAKSLKDMIIIKDETLKEFENKTKREQLTTFSDIYNTYRAFTDKGIELHKSKKEVDKTDLIKLSLGASISLYTAIHIAVKLFY